MQGHHSTHVGLQKHSVGGQYPYSVQMIGDSWVVFKANSGEYLHDFQSFGGTKLQRHLTYGDAQRVVDQVVTANGPIRGTVFLTYSKESS